MKTFLVPVDFSDSSLRALDYAIHLAKRSDANVVVCHIYDQKSFVPGLGAGKQRKAVEEAEQKLNNLLARVDSDGLITEAIVRTGDTVGQVKEAIEAYGVSLVVMATGGGKNLRKRVFGTTTEAIAKLGLCSVLVIPENGDIKPIERIVYAADFENGDQVTVLQLLQLKTLFNASLTFLHIKSDKQPDYIDDAYIKDNLVKEFPQAEINFIEERNDDVVAGITNYVRENDTSLLSFTMLSRHFLDNITHDSVSTKLLHSLNLPMLALPENGALLDLQPKKGSQTSQV